MTPVALITGGQQGIGLGIAQALAGAGFPIAIVAERDADDAAVTSALGTLGPGARYFRHDVADIGAVPPLLDRVEAELGPVTCLVSNAGVPSPVRGDMLDIEPANFDFVMDVNLRGAFFLAQAVARRMAASESDHYRSMLFITSVSAEMVSVERAEYCISKAAAAMIEDGGLQAALDERYAGWGSDEAKAMLDSDLDTIFDKVKAGGIAPEPRSGRQEKLENYVNKFV